ncbi:type IV toxin-antitoxin system AbiEi family antitoxin [Geodermatophilus sp. DF01_2]|uniref:type IV toxin-antitoxin system AbiEi family antitoxin n=1 Tax=Geodermatophilus sp. DF01-2 TaxID=2559610 RepID=UPI001FD86900|nr:type IV toxin-antitoxin system AbiEi family antitoxin [Geodermatophilus sp. DF01_2]
MPRPPSSPPPLRGRVFCGSSVVREGLLTPAQLRSSAWRRLYPDVYACAGLEVTHAIRALAVTRLLLPGAVASGRSAAALWGVDARTPEDDVEVTVPPACRGGAVTGVRVTRRPLPADAVTRTRAVPVTTPLRTALDLARTLPPVDAVVALDALVRTGLVGLADVRGAVATATGRGCRRARDAAARADGLAESPQETRLRLVLHASTLPPPVAQHTVRDAEGRFVARVDFAWPEHRLAVEYEGAWHGQPQNVARDRARLNRLTAAGWRVVFVTAADVYRPAQLLTRIAAALAAPRSA